MYCYTHRCHHCHQCCPVVLPTPALFWCATCVRYTHYQHTHHWAPVSVFPVITCGPQQRDAATIRALAG